MFCNLGGRRFIERDISAGKSHKGQFMLSQKLLEFRRLELCNSIGAKLYAGEADRGNIVDRLTLIIAPRHGGISETNSGQPTREAKGRQSLHSPDCTETSKKSATRRFKAHREWFP